MLYCKTNSLNHETDWNITNYDFKKDKSFYCTQEIMWAWNRWRNVINLPTHIIVGKQNIAFLAKNVSRLGAYAVTNMIMFIDSHIEHCNTIHLVYNLLRYHFNLTMVIICIALIFLKPFRNNEDFKLWTLLV